MPFLFEKKPLRLVCLGVPVYPSWPGNCLQPRSQQQTQRLADDLRGVGLRYGSGHRDRTLHRVVRETRASGDVRRREGDQDGGTHRQLGESICSFVFIFTRHPPQFDPLVRRAIMLEVFSSIRWGYGCEAESWLDISLKSPYAEECFRALIRNL